MEQHASGIVLMKKISLLAPVSKKGNHQFFMDWFSHAWQSNGGDIKYGYSIPWSVRLMIAKLRYSRNLPLLSSRRKALLVPGAGYPDSFAWPHAYTREIIPMLWDVWPKYWPRLIASLQRHRVRTFLCTSSQVCEYVRHHLLSIQAIHVPEGIDPTGYLPGKDLHERPVDILELGRKMPFFHQTAVDLCRQYPQTRHSFSPENAPLLFPDFPSLCQGLSSAKITVSYPRCDTHPEMAGNVETLTQRYWECMLSRTLPVGRAPQELINLLGYNPVVEVHENNAYERILHILTHIGSYQELVNKNHRTAQQMAPWTVRIAGLISRLESLGYHL